MSMEVEGSLVITKVEEDDDAKYQCLAKNVVGTRGSAKAQLSVLGEYFNFLYQILGFQGTWMMMILVLKCLKCSIQTS